MLKRVTMILALSLVMLTSAAFAGNDWPQWGFNAQNNSVSDVKMPGGLKLLWSRELPTPNKAWPDTQYFMQYDKSYEPIAAEGMLFVPSNVTDSVTAYDGATGKVVWRFYGEAPVRFAPVYFKGNVYFVCDDGFLYCVQAKTGKEIWKIRGGPDNRRGLGNGRLCSLWPARGGPVLADGVIYWAASIWPFMGTFIRATDAATGKSIWTNSGNGADWNQMPHGGALAFSGVSPQGYLAVGDETRLLVPNGRNLPGIFNRKTGQVMFQTMYSKWGGTDLRVSWGGVYVSGRRHSVTSLGRGGGASGFLSDKNQIFRVDGKTGAFEGLQHSFKKSPDSRGRMRTVDHWEPIWKTTLTTPMHSVAIKTAEHVYGWGAEGTVVGVALKGGGKAEVDFVGKYQGKPWRMIAANGRLFVVTLEGRLYGYGTDGGRFVHHKLQKAPLPTSGDAKWKVRTEAILKDVDRRGGWVVSLGVGSGGLIESVLQASKVSVIAIEPDAAKADAFRRKMDAAGLYGPRVTVLVGDPLDYDLPPYIAQAIFCEDLQAAGFDASKHRAERVRRPIRPYGGAAVLPVGGVDAGTLKAWAGKGDLDGATVAVVGSDVVIKRTGALPGSAPWTHQHADATNSVVGLDQRVKLPLGLLWFGGNTHLDILPRHGHGPTPQIAGGRLVVEGIDMLSARDVYTGRVLWKKTYPGFSNSGMYWDRSFKPNIYDRTYNQRHIPGANLWGANYVTTPQNVYLINKTKLLVLDADTGDVQKTFTLPAGKYGAPNWGVVLLSDDVLVAAVEPIGIWGQAKKGQQPKPAEKAFRLEGVPGVSLNKPFAPSSRHLVGVDCKTGKVLWRRAAELSFRHNAIAISGGKVFVLDSMSGFQRWWLKMMGIPSPKGSVLALDLKTGRELWKNAQHTHGTWLGYSKEHDILVQGGSRSRDRGSDETGKGIAAYRGKDGSIVWADMELQHAGPLILHGRKIINNGGNGGAVLDLLTGKPLTRTHPLTGQATAWRWERLYGCNTAIAGANMMLFRSGAAGYYDLTDNVGGTGNFGGFKSGCTSNMVPGDGVLNIPDYTRTCTCAYQNQTSLAMVPMTDVETWTFTTLTNPGSTPVRRVGLNLGAPGDRVEDGTLWMDIPSVGSKSPVIHVDFKPGGWKTTGSGRKRKTALTFDGNLFRMHSTLFHGPMAWVAASGADGIESIECQLVPGATTAKKYTVRLVMAAPEATAAAGSRVFDIVIEGKTVEKGLDLVKAAGGPRTSLVREYTGIAVKDKLHVSFKAVKGRAVLCGLEAVAE